MLCDQVREHLSAYLDKELTEELSAAVRAHLDTCAACRTLADELRATADLLGRLPVRAAPEHLAADVIRQIERRGIVPAGAPVEGQPQERTLPMRRARLWPRALAVAATVLLAVGIGVLAYLSETAKMPLATAPSFEVAALPAKPAAAPDHDQLADRSMALGNGAARKEGLGAAPSDNSFTGGTVIDHNGDTRRRLGGGGPVAGGTVVAQPAGGEKGLAINGGTLALKIAPDGAKTGEVAAGPTLPLGTDRAGAVVGYQAEVPPPAQQTGAVAHGKAAATESDGAMLMAKARFAVPATETPAPPPAAPPPAPPLAPPPPAAPAKALAKWEKSVVEKPAATIAPAEKPEVAAKPDATIAPAEKPEVAAKPAELPEAVTKRAEPATVAAKPAAPLRRDESRTDLRPPAATTVPADRPSEEAAQVTLAGPTVVAQMMDDVANGRIAADRLARVATRDNLQAADNQLILRADTPDEADRRLVQLFRANGWRSLAPTGERERSVSGHAVWQDERGEPRKPPAAGPAGAASLPPAEKGQPPAAAGAPGGVYWQASRNGEQVWLVLADRDSLSRFGSRLAQVEGMDVDGDSSTEFRAIARLQQQWKQSLGRQAVAADTEGLIAGARRGEAGRGGQPASGLSSKAATGKAGADTTFDDSATRAKDAKQEAAAPLAWRRPASAPAAAPAAPAPADKAAWGFGQPSGGGAGGAAATAAAQRPGAPQPSRRAYDETPEGSVADVPRAPGAPPAAAKMKEAQKKPDAAEAGDFFDTLAARNAPAPPASAVLLVIRVQPSGAQRAAEEAPAAVPGGKTSP